MEKNKTISYECIVVKASVIPELQKVGMHFNPTFSETSVWAALRFATNSEAAKAVRKRALELGGQQIVKNTVKFV